MKSIRRVQRIITCMLLLFLVVFGILIYKLQSEAGFYISHSDSVPLGLVYDRAGDVLYDSEATAETYGAEHFLDVGNFIGDNERQMTNTLVAQNKSLLANFSFMLGEQPDGKAAIYTTLDHAVNQKVYAAFGKKNGCAVAYNYQTGEIYVCLSRPSVNILNHYSDLDTLENGSLLCKVFYPTVPGSTQKIATTAAAIETMGYDTLLGKRFTCTGSYTNQTGDVIKCHKASGHGEQNLVDAFANSCNPFFAQLVEDPGWELADIEDVYRRMGYLVNEEGEATTLDVNGISGFTASTTLTDKRNFATQWGCIGQGETLVSPLQMMVWQSAIANQSGKCTAPYLIDHVTDVKGDAKAMAKTETGKEIFSAPTASHVRDIMIKNGQQRYTHLLPGTAVGVKSGTAQVENGASENSLLTGFVSDPNFPVAFCVVIEDRKEGEVSTDTIAATLLQSLRASLGV